MQVLCMGFLNDTDLIAADHNRKNNLCSRKEQVLAKYDIWKLINFLICRRRKICLLIKSIVIFQSFSNDV